MPHSTVDKGAVKQLEDFVQYCQESIDKIKTISRSRNEEGVRNALDIIKELKVVAEAQKNTFLRKGTQENFTTAFGWEREERTFQKVLDMFENPQNAVADYKEKIRQAKEQLEKWKNAEKR